MPLRIYKVVYRSKSIGAVADESLKCKEYQLLELINILLDNGYELISVKLEKREEKEDDLQNQ